MESALASTSPRLIEYPADLSGCSFLGFGDRQLLYLCSYSDSGSRFIVVLGFFSGQKQDIITKDLIEPVVDETRARIRDAVALSVPDEYIAAPIFFL